MFGKNLNPRFKYEETGARLMVHTLFNTIQGEGPLTGRPAIFIRLGGCPLHCWFCDTDFDEAASNWYPVEVLAEQCRINWVSAGWKAKPLVVITGGEPLSQNLRPLVNLLHEDDFTVQVETSGVGKNVNLPMGRADMWVVVSPKTATVHKGIAEGADAWKYIIGHDTEVTPEGIPIDDTQQTGQTRQLAAPTDTSRVWLQPREDYLHGADGRTLPNPLQNEANIRRVRELALRFGYNVSIQTHKILGVD